MRRENIDFYRPPARVMKGDSLGTSMKERKRIWAVILAAGESKRMGKPKLLLPFGNRTIIETVVTNVVASGVDGALVVVGAHKEKMLEKIGHYPVKTAFNPEYKRGMLSSVLCGFRSLPPHIRAVLFVLGDQPAISKEIMNKIIDAYKKSGKGIVLPVYRKKRGHPVIIDMKYKKEVEKLSADIGLRGTVYGHQDDTLEVEVDMPDILHDIDVEADYMRELKK